MDSSSLFELIIDNYYYYYYYYYYYLNPLFFLVENSGLLYLYPSIN